MSLGEREQLIEKSRLEGKAMQAKFREGLDGINKRKLQALLAKQQEIERKRRKLLEEKERLTSKICCYGLWQSVEHVVQQLAELASVTEKKAALKSQLTFRKTVLNQKFEDKSVFAFSHNGKQFTVAQLTSYLLKLIRDAFAAPHEETPTSGQPLLVGKRVEHCLIKKCRKDPSKTKRVPYTGSVISVVPGYTAWYNIVYDGDVAVYTYKLQEDWSAGDLKLIATCKIL